MSSQGRRASGASLLALIVLLLCIWLLYRFFIAVPQAPAPRIKVGSLPATAIQIGREA